MRTTFGGLLTSFQQQSKLALETARKEIKRRNKGASNTKLVETTLITHNGETVHSIELWQKIDEEHIKLSANVVSETLKTKPDINNFAKGDPK